jgi:hypothetical protein
MLPYLARDGAVPLPPATKSPRFALDLFVAKYDVPWTPFRSRSCVRLARRADLENLKCSREMLLPPLALIAKDGSASFHSNITVEHGLCP